MSFQQKKPTGLMLSGGVDSAILLAELLDQGYRVQPFYVKMGCVWEVAERAAIGKLIDALASDRVEPLIEFDLPANDLYGDHWSTTGLGSPDESTPDGAVFLWGRNPMLLLKPVLWCQRNGICDLTLGTLAGNPFADATEEFLDRFASAMATGIQKPIHLVQPFKHLTKQGILVRGRPLPLHLTFSCLAPENGMHCGRCNKCAERTTVLRELPDGDPTQYAASHLAPVSN